MCVLQKTFICTFYYTGWWCLEFQARFFFFLWGVGVACIWGLIHKFKWWITEYPMEQKGETESVVSWSWTFVSTTLLLTYLFWKIMLFCFVFLITIFKKTNWQRNNFGNCSCDWSQSTNSNIQSFLHRTRSLKSTELIEQKYTSRN